MALLALHAMRSAKKYVLVLDTNQKSLGRDWGFLTYSIAPHYRSDHPESAAVEKLVQYFIQQKMLFKALHDGEVMLETR